MSELQADMATTPIVFGDGQSATFVALSDPIRRAIIERLARSGPMNVGELSVPFTVSAPAISRHLRILEKAGLVTRTVDRQWRVCTLRVEALSDIRVWLDTVLSPLERF